nr:PREDICTED: fibropellin-1-like [Anolis carolinensis]|eukprot:XP_016851429.1 PREDICTED: fibropellin-1-like [Anolis carolinensis]
MQSSCCERRRQKGLTARGLCCILHLQRGPLLQPEASHNEHRASGHSEGPPDCLCAPGWVGEFCQIVEDACLIYPDNCRAGATCIDVSPSKLLPQVKCVCAAGFTGVFCEMEINECESDPCKHGGTCDDSLGHFTCICPVGFEGEQCEINIDACLFNNITCNPGAQCVDKPYELSYMCGKACKGNSELCDNGGRCYHNEDNQDYQCVCAPGWTGPTCLQNINDCEVSWCQNGGTCEDGINEYRITCSVPTNSGENCAKNVDSCVDQPCQNGATCEDTENGFKCNCSSGKDLYIILAFSFVCVGCASSDISAIYFLTRKTWHVYVVSSWHEEDG